MIKFFRKYNKQLLAVTVIFLMVVFVGGSAFQTLISPGPGSQPLGEAFGDEITGDDRSVLAFQTKVLGQLGFPWNRPWMGSDRRYDASLQPLTLFDYMLLVLEARNTGSEVDLAKARVVLGQLNFDLLKFRLDYGISADQLELAVANFLMVQEQWSTASQSVRASELEIRQGFRDQYETINASIVAIDAELLVDAEADVTEAELQEHFDKYKDKAPGESAFSFGYLIPDHVQVEYIVIDTASVASSADISAGQARLYWEENRSEFRRPAEQPAEDEAVEEPAQDEAGDEATGDEATEEEATEEEAGDPAGQAQPADAPDQAKAGDAPDQPETASAPDLEEAADQEAADADPAVQPDSEEEEPETPPSPYYATYEEAAEDVLKFLRRERQLDEARVMAEDVIRQLRNPWYAQSLGEDGFPERPPGVDGPTYYAETLESLSGILAQPECLTVKQTDLFAVADAGKIDVVGGTAEDVGSGMRPGRFSDLIRQVQGLVDASAMEQQTDQQRLALYETAPHALVDDDKNLYVYRVTKVEKAHAPDGIGDLREQVLADVRRARALEVALDHASRIEASAADMTLQQAWITYDELDLERKGDIGSWFEARPFAKKGESFALPGGGTFDLPVSVVDQAGNADNRIRTPEFITRVFDLLDGSGDSAVGIIEVPGSQKCFVVQLAGANAASTTDYEQAKPRIQRNLTMARMEALKRQWFSSDNIRARTGFKSTS